MARLRRRLANCSSSGITPARASISSSATSRFVERALGLRPHAVRQRGRGRVLEAGGIPDAKAQRAEASGALAAVAGDAGRGIDERRPPPDQPVEQG